jgi:hypothetical protein
MHKYQGLALLHPYHTQGVKSVAVFQQVGLSKELRGGLLQVNTEQAQLEIGTSQPVLQENFSVWGFLLTEHCWIGSLWRFCSEFAITLEAEHLQAPGPQRQIVAYLMELFGARFPFSSSAKQRKEECTLNHQCVEMLRLALLLATPITTPPQSIFEAIKRPRSRWLATKELRLDPCRGSHPGHTGRAGNWR